MNRLLPTRALLFPIAAALACWPQIVAACPTCKDTLTEQHVAAYGMSIVFMMSMPFLILASLGAYFYWEVRKANRQKLLEQAREKASGEEGEASTAPTLANAGHEQQPVAG